MQRTLTRLHRIFGLFTAVFLFVAGLTGAVIAWDHELDEWLNPQLFRAPNGTAGTPLLSGLALAERVELADPRLRAGYVLLAPDPGKTLMLSVSPRVDPRTGEPYELGFDQVALDPTTGAILGQRMWGELSLRRENLLPFIYKLHYSLHLPQAFDLDSGVLLMGLVALVWLLDSVIALWISFPSRKTWRRSFAFRLREGGARLNFDLHRSGGVWTFPLLIALAATAVSMNLGDEVMRPVVSLFSTLSEDPFSAREPQKRPIEPRLSRLQAIEQAKGEAARLGLRAPPGGVFYAEEYGLYGVGFFEPGNSHGDGGLGNPWLYLDGRDGRFAGSFLPGRGSAGDVFMHVQFPLHSGRILGTPGRVIITLLGLSIALLSATGVVIWARRRRRSRSAALEI